MKVLLVVTLLVAATCAFPQNPFEDLLDLIEHRIERWENRLVYPGGNTLFIFKIESQGYVK